ncbi:hypothetical protein NBRC10512_004252 [Rhodotorula toruloides]|uniref:RHTO0S25e00562g1_1 n=2 Tax=Rhodotorula toruloides TaxID=5286 RepID=A0A061BQE3_RHOTO|nr:uncharacterized protein RHTO_05599 [Rhodotorula toruloides NP11]EMS18852.1 hypothetical protein RHTO_05599 [Rhodotorula toruloides NP11]CDR49290.1 RHTO0S25e00562g1_1 [Rhodotorula toruloides]
MPSSTHSSPRARRLARPFPLSMSMPPIPNSFAQPSLPLTTSHAEEDLFEEQYSPTRERTAAYFREAVNEVQSVLYGGKGRDRDEIARVVGELYDGGAIFENPLTLARGKEAIADMFALLALVPGTMWSEMGDLTESRSAYDGNRLMVFTHTLHISLLPSLDSENAPHIGGGGGGAATATPSMRRSYSFFSLPSTPYPQTPSSSYPSCPPETPANETAHPGIFSKTHPAFSARDRWPSTSLLSALNPRTIASALTTLHLKLHTRLLFNEEGRIIAHEDLWGLKELVEGVFPIVGHLYAVNRQGIGWLAGLASRTLLRKQSASSEGKDEEARLIGLRSEAGSKGWSFRTPPQLSGSGKALYGTGAVQDGFGVVRRDEEALGASALGLDVAPVPTTMDELDSGGE